VGRYLYPGWQANVANAWLLYVGVLFIVMVMYAPGGLIGLIFMHRPIWRAGRLRELLVPYAKAFPPALLVMLGSRSAARSAGPVCQRRSSPGARRP
jgi:hypothetical protein